MTGPQPGAAAVDRERMLRRIIDTITTETGLRDLLQGVAGVITETTHTDVCFVHLLDDDGRHLTLSGATPPFDRHAGRVRLHLGEGVAGWVAEHREAVAIAEDKWADPRYRYLPELRGEDYTSLASVPMVSGAGQLVGVLNIHRKARYEFTAADLTELQTIASLMAGAIDNARLHEALEVRERAKERFAERLVQVQENERRRLARDIHDGISQRIVSLAFHLSAASSALGDDPEFASKQLATAKELADAALDETRTAIAGLRPSVLDDLGFAAGVESLARATPGLDVELDVDGIDHLADHVVTALYRIVQEAMQNVVKHAQARRVVVRVRCTDASVILDIADDGRGFDVRHDDPDRTTYGLSGMHERAELVGGRVHVTSTPGEGSTVRVVVPTA